MVVFYLLVLADNVIWKFRIDLLENHKEIIAQT